MEAWLGVDDGFGSCLEDMVWHIAWADGRLPGGSNDGPTNINDYFLLKLVIARG